MNIIYKLTNISKKENPKYYIGSKVECKIENIDGIPTIIDIKTERPYYGSSSSPIMKGDMLNQDIFSAEILKRVGNKKIIVSEENEIINLHNAVNSEEYYNLAQATIGGYKYSNKVINKYGETLHEYARNQCTMNKIINNYEKLGFTSFYDFLKVLNDYLVSGINYAELAKIYRRERHYFVRFLKDYDFSKATEEINNLKDSLQEEVRVMYNNKSSVKFIAKYLNLEYCTVLYYLGDFRTMSKRYISAKRKNKSETELEKEILKLVLDGNSIRQTSEIIKINTVSCYRYFYKALRERLKSSDL